MLEFLKYSLVVSLLVRPVHVGAALAQVDLPGFDRLAVSAAHRPGLVAGSIWYPADQATYKTQVGRNAVFTGATAYLAPGIAKGRHPLVVLSHGLGGNIDGLGWLAGALAQNGAMVLGVNHPGSTGGDSSPRRSIRMWERAWDVSAALDTVLAEPNFAPHIDPERIYSIGFFHGRCDGVATGWVAWGYWGFQSPLYWDGCASLGLHVFCSG
jgi:predicted dienelactone hydrolase